jgi:Holliday junction DNA helicase RuvA
MIAHLSGRAEAITYCSCVIDVGGVGYLVQASTHTLSSLPRPPKVAKMLIETHIRENVILLYGFVEPAERDLFRLLTTVQGVGGKTALAILSAIPSPDLLAAIGAGDNRRIMRAPGIGSRLAARLVTELRDKIAPRSDLPSVARASAPSTVSEDALSALVNLGYRRPEAQGAIGRTLGRLGDEATLEQLIQSSLRDLA